MKQKKKTHAQALTSSLRGQLLISQALYIAIKVLRKQPKHIREVSSIMDMEQMLEYVFPIYKIIEDAKQATKESACEDKN